MTQGTPHRDPRLTTALGHHLAGRLTEAEALYRDVLAEHPDHAGALHLLGVLVGQLGRPDDAVTLIQRAIGLNPAAPQYYSNLGKFLDDQGRVDEAIASLRTAARLAPDYAEPLSNLSALLNASGQFDEAALAAGEASRLQPGLAAAHNNLGNALRGQGRTDEAFDAYRTALQLAPRAAEVHGNLGVLLKDTGRISEAIEAFRTALELRPGYVEAQHQLLNAIHYDPSFDAVAIRDAARRWNREQAAALSRAIQPHQNDRSPDRRLRVGYVSPDFRDHPVGLNLLPLYRAQSHVDLEIFTYANVVRPDALTEEFRSLSDQWRSTVGWSHQQLAAAVRQDAIDILVDLTLHASGNRLFAFALKPAPVQVTFAGYPGTTGLETIDYRLTDPYLDPPGVTDGFYAEASFRLPETFWCVDPAADEIPVGPLPALDRRHVTFGCLNNFCKVNEACLRLWARVLTAVPGSHLLVSSPAGAHRQRVLAFLDAEGVAPARVAFAGRQPRRDYLRLYDGIDIALDTLPYNGHTTSLDAFWMGVPVVTLVGSTVVGRAGLSQAVNLGAEELVAWTPDDFVRIAERLSSDLSRLALVRTSLRERMRRSPLMDGPRFARHIGAAYREMWRRWCAGGESKASTEGSVDGDEARNS
jgi:protein O-GlcNAc transferase